jgi:hypothetical protein
VLAVRPGKPREVVLKTTALDPSRFPERVLVSRDGGETFESIFQGEKITSAAFTDAGQVLFITNEEGLWRSTDDLRTFERQGPASWMSTVVEHDGKLWASGHLAGEGGGPDGVGTSVDDGQTFTVFMDLRQVTEPVACVADAETTVACSDTWAHWQVEVLGPDRTGGGGAAGGEPWQAAGATGWGDRAEKNDGGETGCAVPASRAPVNRAWAVFLLLGAIGATRGARHRGRSPCYLPRRAFLLHRADRVSRRLLQ